MSKTVQLELNPGDKVQGALTILDGDEGITVYIENPRGEASYNGGTVYNKVDFSFSSQTAGQHIAIFTNLSPTNTQTIEYSFTYPALPSIASIVIIVLGVFLLLIGVTFLVILHKANLLNSKKQALTP
jgi:hypothetical protein